MVKVAGDKKEQNRGSFKFKELSYVNLFICQMLNANESYRLTNTKIQIRHFYSVTYTYSDQWRINNVSSHKRLQKETCSGAF